jgi:hypothetical protein
VKGRKENGKNISMRERGGGHDRGISLMWGRNGWERKELCKMFGINVREVSGKGMKLRIKRRGD